MMGNYFDEEKIFRRRRDFAKEFLIDSFVHVNESNVGSYLDGIDLLYPIDVVHLERGLVLKSLQDPRISPYHHKIMYFTSDDSSTDHCGVGGNSRPAWSDSRTGKSWVAGTIEKKKVYRYRVCVEVPKALKSVCSSQGNSGVPLEDTWSIARVVGKTKCELGVKQSVLGGSVQFVIPNFTRHLMLITSSN